MTVKRYTEIVQRLLNLQPEKTYKISPEEIQDVKAVTEMLKVCNPDVIFPYICSHTNRTVKKMFEFEKNYLKY